LRDSTRKEKSPRIARESFNSRRRKFHQRRDSPLVEPQRQLRHSGRAGEASATRNPGLSEGIRTSVRGSCGKVRLKIYRDESSANLSLKKRVWEDFSQNSFRTRLAAGKYRRSDRSRCARFVAARA
jgi:hypothetical protein